MHFKLLYTFFLVAAFLLYPVLNQMPQEVHIIKLWFDEYIPLVPIFSIPYILHIPYLFFSLIFFVYFSRRVHSVSISFLLCSVISSLFYTFYQTTVPRPEIGSKDIFTNLVVLIYTHDKPYNCFPSLHVTSSVLAYLYWRAITQKVWITLKVFTLFVVLSTLFIKQHYTPDVISGIILAFLVYYAGIYIENVFFQNKEKD